MFKIALLTYKSFHNLAPAYLNDTLTFRKLSVTHNVGSNSDLLKLEPKLGLNFVKSEAMFCDTPPDVWNLLPLSVRYNNTVSQFKINLKSLYFSLAFHDL